MTPPLAGEARAPPPIRATDPGRTFPGTRRQEDARRRPPPGGKGERDRPSPTLARCRRFFFERAKGVAFTYLEGGAGDVAPHEENSTSGRLPLGAVRFVIVRPRGPDRLPRAATIFPYPRPAPGGTVAAPPRVPGSTAAGGSPPAFSHGGTSTASGASNMTGTVPPREVPRPLPRRRTEETEREHGVPPVL